MTKKFQNYNDAEEYCRKFGFWLSKRDAVLIFSVAEALQEAYEVGYNDAERTYGGNN